MAKNMHQTGGFQGRSI